MKTLILTCNTGEGHNSCATAIKEYFESNREECYIKDGLGFISLKVSHMISWGHTYIYRHLPRLFEHGYGYSERHPDLFRYGSIVYKFIGQGAEKLFAYISDGDYDTVICTHVFAALMLTEMLEQHPMKIKTAFVSTDYTCSPCTQDSNLDLYFIPGEEFTNDFLCDTITRNKLVPSGIPVRQMFYQRSGKRNAKIRVGVDPNHRHLIMMCGSMGCGPMTNLLHDLELQLPEKWEITVICGRNQKLEKKLSLRYQVHKNIHIKGFVKDMGEMMDSADLYLTKPGGLSVTEAKTKELPMVFVDAVAGCEEYNLRYFVSKGGAVTGSTNVELTKRCLALMGNEQELERMHQDLGALNNGNAAEIIYNRIREMN